MRVLYHFGGEVIERARNEFPDLEHIEVPMDGELDDGVSGEILFTLGRDSPNLRTLLGRGVEWVHSLSTGVDHFPLDALDGRPLTCSRGASAIPISEWCMTQMLAFEKHVPDEWRSSPPEMWNFPRRPLGSLHGARLAIVGLGAIGQLLATQAMAFGMDVRAMRRTSKPSPVTGVEIVTDIASLVADADHIVIAAPATPATSRLIDASVFAAMKPGVHLVNVARGTLVDHDALRAALDDGTVALASLDTSDPEPAPADSWLWEHERVHLSPHVSWNWPRAWEMVAESFVQNIARYVAHEPLTDLVDTVEGY
ncbi:MAG: NAD(P)-binding domain-containing protein [Acidimicrobiia bacterium]|nr:NAD(P)-binding domain-containing protein [Acidimicrobiia bacterium]